MKARTIREMTREELMQRKTDLEEERFNLHMLRSLKALDNPLRLRSIRRDLARLRTILHEDSRGIRSLAQGKTSLLGESK